MTYKNSILSIYNTYLQDANSISLIFHSGRTPVNQTLVLHSFGVCLIFGKSLRCSSSRDKILFIIFLIVVDKFIITCIQSLFYFFQSKWKLKQNPKTLEKIARERTIPGYDNEIIIKIKSPKVTPTNRFENYDQERIKSICRVHIIKNTRLQINIYKRGKQKALQQAIKIANTTWQPKSLSLRRE